jgi:hypothetical protein
MPAPESYLNAKRPAVMEAVRAEGDMSFDEALASLERKGYFTPPPRPWSVGYRDRGHGHGNFAVLDKFGDVVVEAPSQETAEFIVKSSNAFKE